MNLTLNQIPTNIDTVEKLAAWALMLLYRANRTLQVMESPGALSFAVEISLFKDDGGKERMAARILLPLPDDYRTQAVKTWNTVEEFSEVAIPAAFLSN